jgi:hypothetical protein
MPKPDEVVGNVGPFTIFRKSDSREYEIVGPAVEHSPMSYSMIRTTPERLSEISRAIAADARKQK